MGILLGMRLCTSKISEVAVDDNADKYKADRFLNKGVILPIIK